MQLMRFTTLLILLVLAGTTSFGQFRKLNLLATTPLTLDPGTRFKQTMDCRKLEVTLVEIDKRLLKLGKMLAQLSKKKQVQAYGKVEKKYLKLVKIKKKLSYINNKSKISLDDPLIDKLSQPKKINQEKIKQQAIK